MLIFTMIMPAILLFSGAYATVRLRGFWLFHPIRLCRRLKEAGEGSGTSPAKALSTALAGTLGVGNMAGVATALTAGGAGALIWMWISAVCAMGLKYVEVSLAVLFRRRKSAEDGTALVGGAMYYIEALHPGRLGAAGGAVFALLLCANSLLTGTMVQVSAAAAVFPTLPAIAVGCVFALLILFAAAGGGKRITALTASLVPALTAVFTVLSMYIIIRNAALLPDAVRAAVRCAFDFSSDGEGGRSIFGGILGSSAAAGIRFGVTRGILSNEAGSGTSPTAHAAANTKSHHHQGCFGIFEVFADTIALCSLTAAVLLTAPSEGDGIARVVFAYSYYGGKAAGLIIGVSIWLFALATVLCQCYYGMEAAEYLSHRLFPTKMPSSAPRRIFTALCAVFCIVGAVISHGLMWLCADAVISVMTVLNVAAIMPGVPIAAAELKRAESGTPTPTSRPCTSAACTDLAGAALAPPVRAGRQRGTTAGR